MKYIKIDPIDYPLKKDESWWVVHPNSKGGEFIVPNAACTACLKSVLDFKKGILYRTFSAQQEGWVCVATSQTMVEMPQYIFARHFDAEIFVRGIPTLKEQELVEEGKVKVDVLTGKWED